MPNYDWPTGTEHFHFSESIGRKYSLTKGTSGKEVTVVTVKTVVTVSTILRVVTKVRVVTVMRALAELKV